MEIPHLAYALEKKKYEQETMGSSCGGCKGICLCLCYTQNQGYAEAYAKTMYYKSRIPVSVTRQASLLL